MHTGQALATGTAVALYGPFTTAGHTQGLCETLCIQIQKITALGFMHTDISHWGRGEGNPLELFRGRCLCWSCMNGLSAETSSKKQTLR